MKQEDLIRDYTRVEYRENEIAIQVAWLIWKGSHNSRLHWHTVKRISQKADARQVNESIKTLLSNKRYFAICRDCEEKKVIGHMCDADICQSCAEKNHGVVF